MIPSKHLYCIPTEAINKFFHQDEYNKYHLYLDSPCPYDNKVERLYHYKVVLIFISSIYSMQRDFPKLSFPRQKFTKQTTQHVVRFDSLPRSSSNLPRQFWTLHSTGYPVVLRKSENGQWGG